MHISQRVAGKPPDCALLYLYHPNRKPFYFVTTVCTVLLLIPNSLAVWRTVALCSIMYSPKITGRSQSLGITLNMLTPIFVLVIIWERGMNYDGAVSSNIAFISAPSYKNKKVIPQTIYRACGIFCSCKYSCIRNC